MADGDKPLARTSLGPELVDIGPKTVVTTSAIEQVGQVFCYDETLEHIAEEHPEFKVFVPSLEHALHDSIANPTHVVESNPAIHAGGFKFCSEAHTSGGNKYIVVAVKTIEGTSALLKTAYFTDTVPGNVVLDRRS